MAEYVVHSPDGFTIDREETYPTPEVAEQKLDEWVKRYETQGYYSMSDRTRLPLNEIKDYCRIVRIKA
jgi:hypothetical protein